MHNFSGKNLYLSSSGMVPSGIQNFSKNYSGKRVIPQHKPKNPSPKPSLGGEGLLPSEETRDFPEENQNDNAVIYSTAEHKEAQYIPENDTMNFIQSSSQSNLPAQHLLVSSEYRNRLLYPNPADFIVPFGSINNVNNNFFNVLNTTNPLTLSHPVFNFCWTNFILSDKYTFKTKVVGGTASELILAENIQNLLQIEVDRPNTLFYLSQPLQDTFNILNKYAIKVTIDNHNYLRQIESYDPILNKVSVLNPFPFFDIKNGPFDCEIIHPGRSLQANKVFIGGGIDGVNINNYDDLIYLYNVTTNEIRKVIDIEFLSNVFGIEKPFSSQNPTDQLMIIRNQQPVATGSLSLFEENKEFYLFLPEDIYWVARGHSFKLDDTIYFASLEEENEPLSYFHQYKITNVSRLGELQDVVIHKVGKQKIEKGKTYNIFNTSQVKTNANVQFLTLSLVFSVEFKEPPTQFNIVGNYFYPIVQSTQYRLKQDSLVLQPNNSINPEITDIPIDLLSSQNAIGCTGIKKIIPMENGKFLLFTQNYNDLTKLDFLAKNLGLVPDFMGGIDNFLILPFFQEGVVPLNFTGTGLTNSQMSCYELSIVNLILPNIKIESSAVGALVSSLPFVFVEISNETLPSGGNHDQLYSNNPFANKATFICSISDVNNPDIAKFIKINSDGAVQTVKFSPFDNLKFRISLPNGETFKTQQKDFFVPNISNPQLQITMLFRIRKID